MGSHPLYSIFNMVKYFVKFIVLAVSSVCVNSLSQRPCGPPPCELFCPPGQCIENEVVNCIVAPCCARWQCALSKLPPQDLSKISFPPPPPPSKSCPKDAPDFNTPCNVNSSLKCKYGLQECCGKLSHDREMVCSGGSWTGLFVDNKCVCGR